MNPPIWLNVGCGSYLAPQPWVNIDGNDSEYPDNFANGSKTIVPRKPDIVAWSDSLPFPDASVDRIYAGHILEHMNLHNGEVDRTLVEFKRVLAPGGKIMVVGPDLVKCGELLFQRHIDWSTFWQCHGTAGRGNPAAKPYANAKPGDVHLWSTSEEAVWAILSKHWDHSELTICEIGLVEDGWPIVAKPPWQYCIRVDAR